MHSREFNLVRRSCRVPVSATAAARAGGVLERRLLDLTGHCGVAASDCVLALHAHYRPGGSSRVTVIKLFLLSTTQSNLASSRRNPSRSGPRTKRICATRQNVSGESKSATMHQRRRLGASVIACSCSDKTNGAVALRAHPPYYCG
jgi:hypothetical protein